MYCIFPVTCASIVSWWFDHSFSNQGSRGRVTSTSSNICQNLLLPWFAPDHNQLLSELSRVLLGSFEEPRRTQHIQLNPILWITIYHHFHNVWHKVVASLKHPQTFPNQPSIRRSLQSTGGYLADLGINWYWFSVPLNFTIHWYSSWLHLLVLLNFKAVPPAHCTPSAIQPSNLRLRALFRTMQCFDSKRALGGLQAVIECASVHPFFVSPRAGFECRLSNKMWIWICIFNSLRLCFARHRYANRPNPWYQHLRVFYSSFACRPLLNLQFVNARFALSIKNRCRLLPGCLAKEVRLHLLLDLRVSAGLLKWVWPC